MKQWRSKEGGQVAAWGMLLGAKALGAHQLTLFSYLKTRF